MKRLPFILIYLVLAAAWGTLFYQFIAPVRDAQVILMLSAGCLFFSLIWAVFISLFQRLLGWKGYGMCLIPVAIIIVFILGMDRSNFLFMLGLMLISELVTLAKIYSYNRKKGN